MFENSLFSFFTESTIKKSEKRSKIRWFCFAKSTGKKSRVRATISKKVLDICAKTI